MLKPFAPFKTLICGANRNYRRTARRGVTRRGVESLPAPSRPRVPATAAIDRCRAGCRTRCRSAAIGADSGWQHEARMPATGREERAAAGADLVELVLGQRHDAAVGVAGVGGTQAADAAPGCGTRIDPPVSSAIASGAIRAAPAAADPPLLPPGTYSALYRPWSGGAAADRHRRRSQRR
jgi:hypothetical protein